NSTVPTRLNTNFGEVYYTANDRVSNYNALILALQGRFSRTFFNASYTRSSSSDDTQVYPSYINVHQWYGPSIWNAPNRFSLTWNYNLPDVMHDQGFVGRVGSGWIISGTAIIQSGYPINVSTNAPFEPVTNSSGQYIGYKPGSGDYNADGDNEDYPNVASYSQGSSRHAFLNGIFSAGQFTQPTFGQEGNESYDRFVGPNFDEWDTALLKNTRIAEGVNFEFRFEVFNTFNRANLINVDNNLPDGNFGKATSQDTPRFVQLGANITF
ncbi:MAG: carboxypeptidase regulatory-like domain-containing protein, partial [Acidobacteriaceae bacterium]